MPMYTVRFFFSSRPNIEDRSNTKNLYNIRINIGRNCNGRNWLRFEELSKNPRGGAVVVLYGFENL